MIIYDVKLEVHENLNGQIDGTNVLFTTSKAFGKIKIFVNGLLLTNIEDYIIENNTMFRLKSAPRVESNINVYYFIK